LRAKPYPSESELSEAFRYEDGLLYWIKSSRHHRQKGRLAGCLDGAGYWVVELNGRRLYVHRIVWILHFGGVPEGWQIDHINRVKSDNHIKNLRLATHIGNGQNRRLNRNNTSGSANISYDRRKNRWRYDKQIAGLKELRIFKTKAEALAYAMQM
jgi:Drexlerviridae HNH endonuclease